MQEPKNDNYITIKIQCVHNTFILQESGQKCNKQQDVKIFRVVIGIVRLHLERSGFTPYISDMKR